MRTTVNDTSISEGALTLRIIYEVQKRTIPKLKTLSIDPTNCENQLCSQLLDELHKFTLDDLVYRLNNLSPEVLIESSNWESYKTSALQNHENRIQGKTRVSVQKR